MLFFIRFFFLFRRRYRLPLATFYWLLVSSRLAPFQLLSSTPLQASQMQVSSQLAFSLLLLPLFCFAQETEVESRKSLGCGS
ncbi:hypothetical protein SLA2020_047560 [Shorea laevis]